MPIISFYWYVVDRVLELPPHLGTGAKKRRGALPVLRVDSPDLIGRDSTRSGSGHNPESALKPSSEKNSHSDEYVLAFFLCAGGRPFLRAG